MDQSRYTIEEKRMNFQNTDDDNGDDNDYDSNNDQIDCSRNITADTVHNDNTCGIDIR